MFWIIETLHRVLILKYQTISKLLIMKTWEILDRKLNTNVLLLFMLTYKYRNYIMKIE